MEDKMNILEPVIPAIEYYHKKRLSYLKTVILDIENDGITPETPIEQILE
jgi:hypothetical protein